MTSLRRRAQLARLNEQPRTESRRERRLRLLQAWWESLPESQREGLRGRFMQRYRTDIYFRAQVNAARRRRHEER